MRGQPSAKAALTIGSASAFPTFLHVEQKVPNSEVLGLRKCRKGQMERSIFDRTGPTDNSGPPRKVGQFFRKFAGRTEPIHLVLDRNFQEFG